MYRITNYKRRGRTTANPPQRCVVSPILQTRNDASLTPCARFANQSLRKKAPFPTPLTSNARRNNGKRNIHATVVDRHVPVSPTRSPSSQY